ncbi:MULTISPECIES: DUF4249 domain-containing protein [unclassified Saccharicrinis]|uniref:DUF4249 domain-containing protein n=1 Tax=unclassified Saccharicrinis TaxID=2646859 RepID=UPI003D329D36
MKPYYNISISLTVLFCLLLLVACEKKLDYQLTNQESQVVMYAFPMPDSTLKLHASYSTNVLTTSDYKGIQGLKYKIAVNGTEVASGEYPFGEKWLNLPEITSNTHENYIISYLLNDGTSIIGSTTIPQQVPIESLDTVSTSYANKEGDDEEMLRCTLKLNDPVSDENYYQVRVDYIQDVVSSPQSSTIETIDFIKEDKVFLIRDDESVLLTDVDFQGTFTDHLFNGQSYEVSFLIPEEYLNTNSELIPSRLVIHLYTLTPEYYQFLRSTIEEEAFRDYPIFEPVNVFTNINNGIGVVAGLAVDTYTIFLK